MQASLSSHARLACSSPAPCTLSKPQHHLYAPSHTTLNQKLPACTQPRRGCGVVTRAKASSSSKKGGGFAKDTSSSSSSNSKKGGGFEKDSAKPSYSSCPCGSRLKYTDCCQPYHQGQWAPTPVHLARARFSALLLNLPDFLADTTHAESNELVGGRVHCARSKRRLSKAYIQKNVGLLDIWFAETDVPKDISHLGTDAYYIVAAVETGAYTPSRAGASSASTTSTGFGAKNSSKNKNTSRSDWDEDMPTQREFSGELYLKQSGRWFYFRQETEPEGPGLNEWFRQFEEDEDGRTTSGSEDDPMSSRGFTLTNPKRTAAASAYFGPWLVDEWPAPTRGPVATAASSASSSAQATPGFVYLDDLISKMADGMTNDGSEESEEEMKARIRRDAQAIRSIDFDFEAFKFRNTGMM